MQNGIYLPPDRTTPPLNNAAATPTDHPMDAQHVPPPPTSLEHLSSVMENSPRFRALDSLPVKHQAMYQNVVTYYVNENSNFQTNPRLTSNPALRDHLVGLIRQVYGRSAILFALDVEAWELNTHVVTEIGIAIYDPRDQQVSLVPSTTQIHIRIKENMDKVNGRYVPNHATNFIGDATYVMTQADAAMFTQSLVNYYFGKIRLTGYACYLVGHDLKGDLQWMNSLGVSFPLEYQVMDTNHLFRISHGNTNISLKRALLGVGIPYAYLHNAGNDAYYTLLLAMKLCDPQSRTRYALDVFVPSKNVPPPMTEEERVVYDKEKKEKKEAKRQARLEAKARGEKYVPPKQDQQDNAPKRKKKKGPKAATCESIELDSALEAARIIFG
ncbi:Good for full DBP5 activity protein 2 [Candida viswanathii]|uniref:Good for full DBP5 activity protein 2 n=1 Tax=Candida viswanathii TaxID=5486 RepID=A0A367YI06_9ASCO|nr:Good for full DBP5 activity protein 2 [Candida viswanathii]